MSKPTHESERKKTPTNDSNTQTNQEQNKKYNRGMHSSINSANPRRRRHDRVRVPDKLTEELVFHVVHQRVQLVLVRVRIHLPCVLRLGVQPEPE